MSAWSRNIKNLIAMILQQNFGQTVLSRTKGSLLYQESIAQST